MRNYANTFVLLISYFFVLLFVYASVNKILDFENFQLQIAQSRRVYQNKLWMQHFYLRSSEERILRILQYFKNLDNVDADQLFLVPFTRVQLASMSGFRVETVIRTIKNMAANKTIKLKGRRIYL